MDGVVDEPKMSWLHERVRATLVAFFCLSRPQRTPNQCLSGTDVFRPWPDLFVVVVGGGAGGIGILLLLLLLLSLY